MDIRPKQNKLVAFKLDDQMLQDLDREAKLFQTSRSEIIKVAIREYLATYGEKKDKEK